MTNINLNGSMLQEQIEMIRICKNYEECKNCPMITNNGMHIGNSIFVCENLTKKGNEK